MIRYFFMLLLLGSILIPVTEASDYCDLAKDLIKQAVSVSKTDKGKGLKLFIKANKFCDTPQMQYNLGIAYYKYGSFSEAEKYLKLAVSKNKTAKKKENPVWLNNLAMVLIQNRSDLEYARKLALKAIKLNGSFKNAYDTLARAQLASGMYETALKSIVKTSNKWSSSKEIQKSKAEIIDLYSKYYLKKINNGDVEKGLSGLEKGSFVSDIAIVYCKVLVRLGKIDKALLVSNKMVQDFKGNKSIKDLNNEIISKKIQSFYVLFKRGDDAAAVQLAKAFSEQYPQNRDAKKAYDKLFQALIADVSNLQVPETRVDILTDNSANSNRDVTDLLSTIGSDVNTGGKQISLKIDVEHNIPKYKQKNRYGIAVLIGNQKYARENRGLSDVKYAERDVMVMKKYLEKTMGFDSKNIIVENNVTSGDLRTLFGSRENPRGKIHSYIRKNKSDVFIYYVGHGGPGADGKTSYLVPVDATVDYIQNNGYSLSLFYSIIEKLPSKKTTVVLDSCFSGDSVSGSLFKNISPAMVKTSSPIKKLAKTTIFCASGKDQVATWYPEKRHSLFSYFFIKGLQGAADFNKDKKIKSGEMKKYLKEEVPYWADRASNRVQTPLVSGNMDIVIAEFE